MGIHGHRSQPALLKFANGANGLKGKRGKKGKKGITFIFRNKDYPMAYIHTEKVEKIETYGHKWTSMSS